MIDIRHMGVSNNLISACIDRTGNYCQIKMNIDMVKSDIDRLKRQIGIAHNKIDDLNIKSLIKYLELLLRYIDKETGTLELGWHLDYDNLPKAYPISFINEPIYKIDISNYIELSSNQKLISINFKPMAELIAYEYMYRDLGEDLGSIEELLSDTNLVGTQGSNKLLDKFREDGDDIYNLSKTMMIDDCPFIATRDREIHDYFNTKTFKLTKKSCYKEVVQYSCKYATSIIATNILKKCINKNIEYILIGIDDTSINLIINNYSSNIDLKKDILEPVSVQIFGRRFVVEPTINIV